MLPRLLASAFVVGLAACGSSFDSGSAANTTSSGSTTTTGQTGTGHGGSGTGGSGTTTGNGGGTVTSHSPCDGIQDGFAVDTHCYVVLHDQPLGFEDANKQCGSIGNGMRRSYLAHLGDPLEEKQIDGQLKAKNLGQGFDFWIGLRCDEDNVLDCYAPGIGPDPALWAARWHWLDDQSAVGGYSNWSLPVPVHEGGPPTPNDRCAALHNYGTSSADAQWHWAGRDCTANQFAGGSDTLYLAALCEIE